MDKSPIEEKSGLSFIEVISDNPFVLFKKWFEEAKQSSLVMPETLTLATANKEGKPSARTLFLRSIDVDGFIIVTDRRGKKAQELEVNPRGAMVFAWLYKKEDGSTVWRQVRAEGRVVELEPSVYQSFYDDSPLYCKVRSHLCEQGATVDWQEHKNKHDQILKEVKEEGRQLPMPDHFVGYKLIPEEMDFYFCEEDSIADRIFFTKSGDWKNWKNHRIAA